ncbi:lytic polysaccharide monooxygenase [Pseudoalteromonas sp. R3]|uniref:lytic polysaccharide monooxygenase n=1 Tax=Pseudoalteromonas sp. R3 TaxID=1709477 RepID=UPI0006B617CB|nr:lytic polysaccharide monooxygenase [Pseudoalteromonas sp. R3]
MKTYTSFSKQTAMGALVFSALSYSELAVSHGYMDFPMARQAICEDQGGYWWPEDGSNIPNAACRAAYLESGYVQFIQEHEFAVNTPDYNNQQAVEKNIPDGTLCAAGSHEKRGMNLPSADWQTTQVRPNAAGELAIRFHATTPHNPSFWKFYLTKPEFNPATDVMTWGSLDLITEVGNVDFVKDPDGKRIYEMTIQIPQGRSGDAILYTRWQRNDVVGEGFYNCSDINIVTDTQPNDWFSAGYFITRGQTANVGDLIWARVFDQNGQEIVKHSLAVTAQNQSSWTSVLAGQLNTTYASDVQVGVKQSNGDVVFDEANLLSNEVFVTDAAFTYNLTIVPKAPNTPPTVHQPDPVVMDENSQVQVHVHAFDDEQTELTYNWSLPSGLTMTGSGATVTLQSAEISADTQYTVSIAVSDGELTTSRDLSVTVKDIPVSTHPKWQASDTYVGGDKVSHNGKNYEAKWWTRGEEPGKAQVWKAL